MATSGSKRAWFTDWNYLEFKWSLTEPEYPEEEGGDVYDIKWQLILGATSSGYISSSTAKPCKVTIGNQTVFSKSVTIGISNNSTKVLASGTLGNYNVPQSFTFSVDVDITFSNEWISTVSGSGTIGSSASQEQLPPSQPSCITWPNHTQNVGDFGDTISIHTNRKDSNYLHTIRYKFGSQSGTIATNVGTGTTWTIPKSLMDLIPNVLSGSGTIYADTYLHGVFIGTKYCGFTATVPASVKPSCSMTLDDITKIDEIYGRPVQNLSRINIAVATTPAYSSPIVSCKITANGVTYSATNATTGLLLESGDSPVVVTVTDTRGRTGTASYTMKVLEYTPPIVSLLTVHRCNKDGTANDQGEYVRVAFSAEISKIDGTNSADYALQWKASTEEYYSEESFDSLDGAYSVTGQTFIFEANATSSYDVRVVATDSHNTTVRSTRASTAFSLMDWHPSGTGIRFGGIAERENTIQNDLALRQVGNSYAFQPESFNGAGGYTLLAMITLNALNVNAPIVFTINRRGAVCPMKVYVQFASSSSTLDPDLASIAYEGDNYGAFLCKMAPSTWRLYVDNTSGWSNPCLQEWFTTDNQLARISIDFPSEQVDELPQPWYRATPAKMQSLLDYIYPVGSIYLSYSHVSPATLFGGTWARISNAFLWGVDENGTIGQTGGEKTHKLTVAEMPSHSHGSVYSGNVSSKNYAWFSGSGSSMGYGAVTAGGGEAHNNMPPYVQISIWRRTA